MGGAIGGFAWYAGSSLRTSGGSERGFGRQPVVNSEFRGTHYFPDNCTLFLPQALADKDGKRLLSWRGRMLPYVDAYPLYKEFHLNEPWDSEHKRKLISQMPDVYRTTSTAGQSQIDNGKTRFVAPLQRFTLTCGREDRFFIAVSLLPPASIVFDNK